MIEKFKLKHLLQLLRTTFDEWLKKGPFNLSAIVAYYAILSLPALLILILEIVGSIWGRELVQGEVYGELAKTFGVETAEYLKGILSETSSRSTSTAAKFLGIGTLIYGATGVFYQLQNALDAIWETEPNYSNGFLATLFGRLKSLGFILIFGFLLLISFVLTSLLSAFSKRINDLMPDGFLELAVLFDIIVTLGFIYLLFAAMFKYLPSTPVPWAAVKPGAALTAILFVIGKYVLSYYFSIAEPGSTYGAAGSIILIMLWVSYTSLILFFGAQFTKVYSDRYLQLR